MNTPQNTVTDNGLAGIPCVEHGTECDGSTDFCEPDRQQVSNSLTMCPMHCGNTAATCKARGRCVYVVTDRNATGR